MNIPSSMRVNRTGRERERNMHRDKSAYNKRLQLAVMALDNEVRHAFEHIADINTLVNR